ncbi:MAG TPA: hypothetical protein VF691_04715 [Cytophagaceae bacterium]|jgi:hypothetical protein
MKYFAATFLSLAIYNSVQAQDIKSYTLKEEKIISISTKNRIETYNGKTALVVEQSKLGEYAYTIIKDTDFHNGTIEIDLAGQPKADAPQGSRGFVGIAFRLAKDTSKFELIYLRPSNGRADDQVRRNHSTQYVSYPGFPWERLRKESPEKYESYADLVPGEWTKVKIEVLDEKARLYLNGSSQPTLIINDLKQRKDLRGNIALWVGPGTLAQFANLRIQKLD